MTTTKIINALTVAHLSLRYGNPMTAAEKAEAARALQMVRFHTGPERVAIHEAVLKAANLFRALRGGLIMDPIEVYRGYEIHPDLAGYGYVASLPEYDLGMTVVHGWSVEAVRREIDTQIADGEFPEPERQPVRRRAWRGSAMSAKPKPFITQISGKPGSASKTVFSSGAVSTDLNCAKFFMMMQDDGSSIDDARRYAKIGPMLSPTVDWGEINRVLDSFAGHIR